MKPLYQQIINQALEKESTSHISIEYVPFQTIKCAALFYKHRNAYTILCQKELPDEVELFVMLHEIGHISLGKMCDKPRSQWSMSVETEVNLWALEKLRPYLRIDFYRQLRYDFSIDENLGFERIKKQLKRQLIFTKETIWANGTN